MDHTNDIPLSEKQMFRALLLLSGHALADFNLEACEQGRVRVHGPHGTATYPRTGWISSFGNHLYQGWFDEVSV